MGFSNNESQGISSLGSSKYDLMTCKELRQMLDAEQSNRFNLELKIISLQKHLDAATSERDSQATRFTKSVRYIKELEDGLTGLVPNLNTFLVSRRAASSNSSASPFEEAIQDATATQLALSEARARISFLEKENKCLSSRLQNSNAELLHVKNSYDSYVSTQEKDQEMLRERIGFLMKQQGVEASRILTDSARSITQQLMGADKEISMLKMENEKLTSSLTTYQNEIQFRHKQMNQAEATFQTLQQHYQAASTSLTQVREEHLKSQLEVSQLQLAVRSLTASKTHLLSQVEDLTIEKEELETFTVDLKAALEAATAKGLAVSDELQRLQCRLHESDVISNQLRSQLRAKDVEHNIEVDSLKRDVSRLQEETRDLRGRVTAVLSQNRELLESSCRKIETTGGAMRQLETLLRAELDEKSVSLRELARELDAVRRRAEENESKLKSSEVTVKSVTAKLRLAELRNREIDREFNEAVKKCASAEKALAVAREELKQSRRLSFCSSVESGENEPSAGEEGRTRDCSHAKLVTVLKCELKEVLLQLANHKELLQASGDVVTKAFNSASEAREEAATSQAQTDRLKSQLRIVNRQLSETQLESETTRRRLQLMSKELEALRVVRNLKFSSHAASVSFEEDKTGCKIHTNQSEEFSVQELTRQVHSVLQDALEEFKEKCKSLSEDDTEESSLHNDPPSDSLMEPEKAVSCGGRLQSVVQVACRLRTLLQQRSQEVAMLKKSMESWRVSTQERELQRQVEHAEKEEDFVRGVVKERDFLRQQVHVLSNRILELQRYVVGVVGQTDKEQRLLEEVVERERKAKIDADERLETLRKQVASETEVRSQERRAAVEESGMQIAPLSAECLVVSGSIEGTSAKANSQVCDQDVECSAIFRECSQLQSAAEDVNMNEEHVNNCTDDNIDVNEC